MANIKPGICFVGSVRYTNPLTQTDRQKFTALSKLGSVNVIAFVDKFYPLLFEDIARFYLLPVWSHPTFRYMALLLLGPWLTLWCIFFHGDQIIIAQSPFEGFAAAVAKRIAQILNTQVVLIIENHGDFEESLFLQRQVLLPKVYKNLMLMVAKFSLKQADFVRVISDSTAAQMSRWVPGKPQFRFVAWTDISVFLEAFTKYSKPLKRSILYAGVLIPRKGIHYLINAFSDIANEFPELTLIIIGCATNRLYAKQLTEQVKTLDLIDRVFFLDEIPQYCLARYMREANVFVLPSFSEGLGRVVFEAMATGTPVIGSAVGGIPEMITSGETGFLVPEGDERALAERLRWVLTHLRENQNMSLKAHEFAKHFFSTEKYVQGYKEIVDAAKSALTSK